MTTRMRWSVAERAVGTRRSAERTCVAVQRGLAAEMRIEHLRAGLDAAVPDEVDQSGHTFSLLDGVGEHAFEPGAQADRVDRLLVRDAVDAGVPFVEEDDLL